MSDTLEQVERTQSLAIQTSFLKEVAQIPAMTPRTGGMPKVVIQGDIRLRVTESSAALRPIKGHYRIETEGMQEPLQVCQVPEKLNIKVRVTKGQLADHDLWHSDQATGDLTLRVAGLDYKN